jgi:hypothetical protein
METKTNKYTLTGPPKPHEIKKCKIELAGGHEYVYAWSIAEGLIKHGQAKFVRWA